MRGIEDMDVSRLGRWQSARPLLIDAKIVDDGGSWWLKDAFRGH